LVDGSGVYAGQNQSSSRHSCEAVGKQSKGACRSTAGQRHAGVVRGWSSRHGMPRLDGFVTDEFRKTYTVGLFRTTPDANVDLLVSLTKGVGRGAGPALRRPAARM
jgi:hypothetical protein